ncbi:MAG TPA: hypothetical protein DDW52_29770, partial [Planctomycetaceae bacterium]|nr:hypothetical protein [Planctomycetaceae bacterium]
MARSIWIATWQLAVFHTLLICLCQSVHSQPPQASAGLASLSARDVEQLATSSGNASRGAILFHSAQLACGRCHSVSAAGPDLLGPNLARPLKREGFAHLWESLIEPSKVVSPEYQALQILTSEGEALSGLLLHRDANQVKLRTPDTLQTLTFETNEIEAIKTSSTSLMPTGLITSLANRQQVADLMRYVVEIQSGGPKRARELQPTAAQLAIQLPEYESNIDHAGIISDLDEEAFDRGEAIYNSLCVNCHGTRQKPGSLATALRFGEGKFKYGDDPFSMYQTLTRGGGLMLPQPWMVPQQKYDVIHYIRQHYLANQSDLQIDSDYLAALPEGTDRGPAPKKIEPWSQANYGPRLIATYEIGRGARNIAQKGIAIQLDQSPGGIAAGNAWAIFDHDTMRLAGVWSSGGFIDWQGINFDGRHGIHPHVAGDILVNNPTGPGWVHPDSAQSAFSAAIRSRAEQELLDGLADDSRVEGRDGRRYGPLPSQWAAYRGFRQSGQHTLIDYTIGDVPVTESYAWISQPTNFHETPNSGDTKNQQPTFARYLTVAPHDQPMYLVAATLEEGLSWSLDGRRAHSPVWKTDSSTNHLFDGSHFLEAELPAELSTTDEDFTIIVEGKFDSDGTLCAIAPAEGDWAPGGQSLFIRGGRIAFDVGWVGQVTGPKVVDGSPHTIMLAYRAE